MGYSCVLAVTMFNIIGWMGSWNKTATTMFAKSLSGQKLT